MLRQYMKHIKSIHLAQEASQKHMADMAKSSFPNELRKLQNSPKMKVIQQQIYYSIQVPTLCRNQKLEKVEHKLFSERKYSSCGRYV